MLRGLLGKLIPAPRTAVELVRSHWESARGAAHAADAPSGQRGGLDEGGEVPAGAGAALVAFHLEQLLRYVVEEDAAARKPAGGGGGGGAVLMRTPCLEYVVEARVPEEVVRWAQADRPPGVRHAVLSFFTTLIGAVRQPLLPDQAVRGALAQLVASCARLRLLDDPDQHGTHLALAELLVAVVRRLVEQPELLPLFFQAGRTRPSFAVFTTLLEYVDCRGRLGLTAREGVLLTELLSHMVADDNPPTPSAGPGLARSKSSGGGGGAPEATLADYIVDHSGAPQLIAAKLAELYCGLPTVPPADADADAHRGSRTLAAFLDLLKFADQLIQQAGEQSRLAAALATAIETTLLRRLVPEALLHPSEDGALTATWHLVHALRIIETDTLAHCFAAFLVGALPPPNAPAVPDAFAATPLALTLVRRIDALSQPLSLATVALFDALLGLHQLEPVVLLVLRPRTADDSRSSGPGPLVRPESAGPLTRIESSGPSLETLQEPTSRAATAEDVYEQVGRFLTLPLDGLASPDDDDDDDDGPNDVLEGGVALSPARPAKPATPASPALPLRPGTAAALSPALPPRSTTTSGVAAPPESANDLGSLPTLADARSFATNFLHFVLTGDVTEDEDTADGVVVRRVNGMPPPGQRRGVPMAPAPTAHDSYFADAQDAQHEYFGRVQAWPAAATALVAAPGSGDAWSADGPLLRMLLDSLAQLADVPFNKALLLTSCLAKLAQWTWPASLHRELLIPDDANPAGLYAVLERVAVELRDRIDRSATRARIRAHLERHRATAVGTKPPAPRATRAPHDLPVRSGPVMLTIACAHCPIALAHLPQM